MTNLAYRNALENSPEARRAALGATRQMIADDSFDALVAALVRTKAIEPPIMADALEALADGLIRKARGEMETDRMVFPSECFDRARELSAQAARLRASARP